MKQEKLKKLEEEGKEAPEEDNEEEKEELVDVMHWQQNKKEGAMMIRINAKAAGSLDFGDKLKVTVNFVDADGIQTPLSGFTKEGVEGMQWALIGHFDLKQPLTKVEKLKLKVESELVKAPKYTTTRSTAYGSVGVGTFDEGDVYSIY